MLVSRLVEGGELLRTRLLHVYTPLTRLLHASYPPLTRLLLRTRLLHSLHASYTPFTRLLAPYTTLTRFTCHTLACYVCCSVHAFYTLYTPLTRLLHASYTQLAGGLWVHTRLRLHTPCTPLTRHTRLLHASHTPQVGCWSLGIRNWNINTISAWVVSCRKPSLWRGCRKRVGRWGRGKWR